MKLTKFLTLVASVSLFAGSAHALVYIGNLTPNTPSGAGQEVTYINTLIGDNLDSVNPALPHTYVDGSRVYTRYISDAAADLLDPVSQLDSWKNESPNAASIDVSGWTYLYLKYGGGNVAGYSLVFLIEAADAIITDLPASFDGKGLSHYTLYTRTSVPDSASTLALLGLGLGALGFVARRRKA